MSRPFLVFVRAGSSTLHPQWLADDPQRNWDCWVSWYCPRDLRPSAEGEYQSDDGDNKLEGFLDGAPLRGGALDLSNYRYIALIDDDIEFEPADISRAFDLCERNFLDLAQPSLRLGSNSNHDVTLCNPICQVRAVSFVEVMMPFFRYSVLMKLLDTFRLSKSTWGIDYAWASLLAHQSENVARIAVLDAIQAHHTKPFNTKSGVFYRHLAKQGVNAEEEYGRIKASYPGFGGLKSLGTGHVLSAGWQFLPEFMRWRVIRLAESLKKRIHRYRIPKRLNHGNGAE